MSFDEYSAQVFGDCQRVAAHKGISAEAMEVLQLIAQQNILMLKMYHEKVVLPLFAGDADRETGAGDD